MAGEAAGQACALGGGGGSGPPGGFIQRCEVQPFSVTIDYQPHSIDIAALRRCVLCMLCMLCVLRMAWAGVVNGCRGGAQWALPRP